MVFVPAALSALCALAAVACRGEPAVPVIGIAGPVPSPGVVEVARDALAETGLDSTRLRLYAAPGGVGLADQVQMAADLASIPGIVGVVGHPGSRPSLLGAPIYAEAGIPLVVPIGTSRRLRDAGPWVFRMVPDDSVEGAFIADFAVRTLRARSVTVIHVNDEYGLGLRTGVEQALPGLGAALTDAVPVGASLCPPGATSGDFDVALRASLRRGRPDAVVIASGTAVAGCIGRTVDAMLPGVPLILGDGAEPEPAFLGTISGSGPWFFVGFWHPGPGGAAGARFAERFRRIVGRDPRAAEALWHDAIMVLAAAVREAGPRPARVRAYLEELGGDRPAFEGVSGGVTFRGSRALRLVMLRATRDSVTVVHAP